VGKKSPCDHPALSPATELQMTQLSSPAARMSNLSDSVASASPLEEDLPIQQDQLGNDQPRHSMGLFLVHGQPARDPNNSYRNEGTLRPDVVYAWRLALSHSPEVPIQNFGPTPAAHTLYSAPLPLRLPCASSERKPQRCRT
jgi:hypothetical protein